MAQICLIGKLGQDPNFIEISEGFGVPVRISETGEEFLTDKLSVTYFIIDEFEGPVFENLLKSECRILGPVALKELAQSNKELPLVKKRKLTKPVYCYMMKDTIIGLIGFNEEDYDYLAKLCYFMGANVMKNQYGKITHLVASSHSVEEYWYGRTFNVPIMAESWITSAWNNRDAVEYSCINSPAMVEHKLKFGGAKVCFIGFDGDETAKLNEILINHKGKLSHDSDCDYLVVNNKTINTLPESTLSNCHIVTQDWFWSSVEAEQCEDENEYLFKTISEDDSCISRGRKRKRRHQRENSDELESPLFRKRRSVSRSALLSLSSSYVECSITPEKNLGSEQYDIKSCKSQPIVTGRYQVFKELLDTEENYVNILKTILKGFKEPLLDNTTKENAILNPTEVNIIFGKLPPIYELHLNILKDLRRGFNNNVETFSVGDVILKYAPELDKAYCPFINYFENIKQTLEICEETKPRFRAFLEEMKEIEPDCQKQSLKELLIRPVQRLPSVSLLLNELKKKTDARNIDHCNLEDALICIKQAMTNINENKKRTEAQIMMLNLPNEIENCPPDLVSSDRSLVIKCECVELTEVLSSKKQTVLFLLFTDAIEICKKQAKPFNTFKTPKTINAQKDNKNQYKHVRRINLTDLRKVINIKESEECPKGFAVLYRSNESLSESLFRIIDDSVDKLNFLNEICQQIVNTLKNIGGYVRKGPNDFYDEMEANEISPDSALNVSIRSTRSFSKALRFSVRGGLRRVLSMSKTPKKLKREISTVQAFVAEGILTRSASRLSQKKLQSCANLSELNFTPPRDISSPIAPMTVPAPRRNKLKAVFSVSSLKF